MLQSSRRARVFIRRRSHGARRRPLKLLAKRLGVTAWHMDEAIDLHVPLEDAWRWLSLLKAGAIDMTHDLKNMIARDNATPRDFPALLFASKFNRQKHSPRSIGAVAKGEIGGLCRSNDASGRL